MSDRGGSSNLAASDMVRSWEKATKALFPSIATLSQDTCSLASVSNRTAGRNELMSISSFAKAARFSSGRDGAQ